MFLKSRAIVRLCFFAPGNHTLATIANHSRRNAKARAAGLDEKPLFLFHAFHLLHSPLQVRMLHGNS